MRVGEAEHDDADGLTAEGRRQARTAFAALQRRATTARVITSPTLRARQTAEIGCRLLGVPLAVEPRLVERAIALPPRSTIRDGRERQQEAVARWQAVPASDERFASHRRRVTTFLRAIDADLVAEATVIAVTHGGTIEMIHRVLTKSPLSAMRSMFVACRPGRFHLWSRVVVGARRVWRLDGVDLDPRSVGAWS